jgi:sugar phosphate isomerase/epimerase
MRTDRVFPLYDRRRFLAASLAGVIGLRSACAISETKPGFFARHALPIGLQLYTVSDAARTDLENTLTKVANIGFRAVELAGFHGHDARALRAAADRAGLLFTSIHLNAEPRGSDPGLNGDLASLCAALRVLGITNVVMPMFLFPLQAPPRMENEPFRDYRRRIAAVLTEDDWQRTAAYLNEKGDALKREGIRLGYHNHNPEFAPLGNTNGFEVLMRETQPDLVSFELDAGWAAAAGVDLIQLLARHPRRFRQMHLNDLADTPTNYVFQLDPAVIGSGTIDWSAVLHAAYAAGVRQFFVEQEPPFTQDRFAAIAESAAHVRNVD